MADRTPCLVPFCGRTTVTARLAMRGDVEWICGTHWRSLPERVRAVYRRARAAEVRASAADAAAYARLATVPDVWRLPEQDPIVVDRLRAAWRAATAMRRCRRLWSACKGRVIEAAGGIG